MGKRMQWSWIPPWICACIFWCATTTRSDALTSFSAKAFAQCPQTYHSFRRDFTSHGMTSSQQEDLANDDEAGNLDMAVFQARKKQQEESKEPVNNGSEEFDGYALRDVIYEKWGKCYDVDFNRVDSFGFRSLYLNVLPFHLGGRKFRHETEMDYLCHLQAVVEILEKYDQIGYILAQIDETNKKPRAGTSPLVAVPLRLDLSREEVTEIIGY
ncbi:protein of unknown function DUF3067 containing protein [Nitzschia inconspicua]|uniref:Uncharacterized protein n=1 Tax=Nitzschia inconspicua TaxID=303405 RepID=A0A9K3K6T5_9STRA|nr:protein of unknown function DUF3067 containing protein [Nitzschia inconspicua]KAG7352944.1 protein of unknown function DUF3067 containing protein [Nitzschia inconspicua]